MICTTTVGKLAPIFVNESSSVFTFFGEVCYTGDPFQTLIRETHNGQTKELTRGQCGTRLYVGR